MLRSAHEAMADLAERRPELADFTARRGRLGPEPDIAWEATLAGVATERGYWAGRAREAAAVVGGAGDVPSLMELLYGGDDDWRPEAVALMDEAVAAGSTVAALTNDLAAFHGDADLTRHHVLARFDLIVDGSVTGVLKPDPRAYAIALERLGRPAGEVVFVDDMPVNAAGGRAVGMHVVEVDLARPDVAFARARELLELGRPG